MLWPTENTVQDIAHRFGLRFHGEFPKFLVKSILAGFDSEPSAPNSYNIKPAGESLSLRVYLFRDRAVSIPQVAIVGRPNVGKSSLFNWLAGRRIAIVDPTPGVTRDRLKTALEIRGSYVEIVDTGGMGIEDTDNLTRDVERQIDLALNQADVVLFVVDTRSGLVPLDDEVARRLRGIGKPVLLIANKCDTAGMAPQAAEFHRLGFDDVLRVSAKQNRGRGELLELIYRNLPTESAKKADRKEPALKLAIVGRRNTGKSTFINVLAHEERTIVSEVAGTTRDSVDIRFEKDRKEIVAIDTAGVR